MQANLNDLAPAWIPGVGWEPGAGDAWDNMTVFDFNGHALPSIKCYEDARALIH